VDAGDPLLINDEDDAGESHERCSDEDGSAAGDGGPVGIFAAKSLAHTDGGGGSDAERNHVGKGNGVERDLMRGKWNRAEARDERSDGGEDSALKSELKRGGNAERDQLPDAAQIQIHRSLQQFGAMFSVVPEKITDQDSSHVDAGDGGGPAGANRAHGGESPFAVNEQPVEHGVD